MNVRLIIPETYRNKDSFYDCNDTIATYLPRYLKTIANIAGGYTSYRGTGGWIDSKGELVEEPVTIVDVSTQSHTDWGLSPTAITQVSTFRKLARTIAAELSQECVFLSIDGKAEFIRP